MREGRGLFKASFIIASFIVLFSVGQWIFVLAEQDKPAAGSDERVAIEDKIRELERLIHQKGSEKLKKQAEELKKIEKPTEPETLQQGAEARDAQMTQEAVDMQQKRIREIEQITYESIPPPQNKRQYLSCKAILEQDVNLCNNIEGESEIKDCRARFQASVFADLLGEIVNSQRVTARALDLCRQMSNDISTGDCKLTANACLSGDASAIAIIPVFKGWQPEAMALISGNPEYCKGVESEEGMRNCRNNAAYASAIKTKSPQACLDITDDILLRKICQLYFDKDKNSCEELIK